MMKPAKKPSREKLKLSLSRRSGRSSRQSTINQYFGGKPLAYQSTLTKFLKKQDDSHATTPPDDSSSPNNDTVADDPNSVDENIETNHQSHNTSDAHSNASSPSDATMIDLTNSIKVESSEADHQPCSTSSDILNSTKVENDHQSHSDISSPSDATMIDLAHAIKVETDQPGKTSGIRNPFKKPISSQIPQTQPNVPSRPVVEHCGDSANGGSSRKPLSLKVRKRKYHTVISPESSMNLKSLSSSKIPRVEENGLSEDEVDLLSMYAGGIQNQKTLTLSDLEHSDKASLETPSLESCPPDSTSRHEVSTPTKPRIIHNQLPLTPTFSPRRHSPKHFSPFLQRRAKCTRSLDTNTPATSAPATSTPEGSGQIVRSHTSSDLTSSKRRVLFSESKPLVPSSAENLSVSSGEYGFEDDMNLSEFLDQSEFLREWDSSLSRQSPGLCRYLVLEKVSQMSSNTERSKPEIMLRLFDGKTNAEEICYLRDDWLFSDVQPGDMVQLNADYDQTNSCYTVDNTAQFSSIVVNPDILISGTSVANSITCVRRAVLSEKFKSQRSGGNEAMVIGQLLHEVFQRVLLRRQEAGPSLSGGELGGVVREEIKKVLNTVDTLDQLFCREMSEAAALKLLTQQVPAIVEWCDRYMHSEPVEEKGSSNCKVPYTEGGNNNSVVITEIVDIEENIWSPRYGLKGRVDVSVSIKERRQVTQERDPETTTVTSRVPLELKTGKMFRKQGTIEHRAQVALYTLMLGDRYSTHSPGGLLYYMKGGHMQSLPSLPHEIRGLINTRNYLSRYHTTSGDCMTVPGLLKDKHTCKYCPSIKECMLYHSAVEQGNELSSGVGELFREQVSHLSPSHLQFFVEWYSLVAQEEAQGKARDGSPLWLADPREREKEGLCHSSLTALPVDSSSPLKRHTQTFTQTPPSPHSSDSLLSVNDGVVISRQDGTGWAVAMGTITKPLSDGEIEVLVDKTVPSDNATLYRIDAAPSHRGGAMAGNLADFCTSDSERDHRLRGLVIDLLPPQFTADQSVQMTYSDEAHSIMSTLNSSQRNAVTKVLRSEDYTLILGMPGTGKTTTISFLVRLLVTLGRTVLLTSYTHSAVDNILLKLKTEGVDFLRLGSLSRVHPSVQEYTPAHRCSETSTVQDLERLYLGTPVVATTCLGIRHPLFSRRCFDVCIVDEASQITLPVSLGPLRLASKFVLVGDHYQLPPLVQSQQAREGGLDVSLFQYLSEHHPSALVSLDLQYRMNREIMSLSNKLIYNSCLKCGTEEVAQGRLSLPHLSTHPVPTPHGCPVCETLLAHSWLREVVNPSIPVLFINTDQCSNGAESIAGGHVCNMFEAELMTTMVETLVKFGLSPDRMGVITPLRYQQSVIRQQISSRVSDAGDLGAIEVNTIDKYQGRDKECILVSFVRSNLKGNTGPLLKDWRRINVALTRAKHKLILVGSYNTLKRTPLLECLLKHLVEHQCLFHLTESML